MTYLFEHFATIPRAISNQQYIDRNGLARLSIVLPSVGNRMMQHADIINAGFARTFLIHRDIF
ncbi:hypothetical protein ABH898_002709 [Paenibacillus sp. RC82]|uniref:hypothetical protein n=1 Tax=Paenibacillus sp. RC82 TaxID=3156251 RepID=UPI003838E39A